MYVFLARSAGVLRSASVRGDARLDVLSGDVSVDGTSHRHGAFSASLVLGF
jgi:hypothetical protein